MSTEGTLFETDPSEESESDLHQESLASFEKVRLMSTEWTVSTLLSMMEQGHIELDPPYQRREAWRPVRQSIYIESLLLGFPVPEVVLAEKKDHSLIVIDGKQRLLALKRFAGSFPSEGGVQKGPLKLRGLEVRADLNGKTFSDLLDSPSGHSDAEALLNRGVRCAVIRNWPTEDFLYRVFLRLNQNSVKLSPQELRQALLPGPFVSFVAERSEQSDELQRALRLREPDFRMRDVELLVRFFAFSNFLDQYNGNLKDFLDLTCRTLNKKWNDREDEIREAADQCDAAIAFTFRIFGKDAFRRWSGEQFEGRFNRAIFDVMIFYFRHEVVRSAAENKRLNVIQAFKEVSATPRFSEAVQSTTKSLGSTADRLIGWGDSLSACLEIPLPVPSFSGRRLSYGKS